MALSANRLFGLLVVLSAVALMAVALVSALAVAVVLAPLAVAFWLVGGLVGRLSNFVTSPSIAQRASSPTESQHGDRRLTLFVASVFGLLFGLTGGLAAGLVGVLVFGLPISGTSWPRFVVASLWLGTRRRLPLRLMGFLDDAYRLGLLRIVGPVYQFRHAALQDHLATSAKSTTPTAGPSTPLKT